MKKLLVLLGGLGVSFVFSASQTSVSQFGITWTFDQAYEVGQFVNGDWWVAGPVTIQSVSPAPTGTRNGSMVNPGIDVQAYDDRIGSFNAAQAASFPLVLEPDRSLVSGISNPEASDCMQGPHPGWLDDRGNCYLGYLKTAAVLTCVGGAKPAGTFRPPYNGSAYKPYFSTGNVCWNLLPRLAAPASKPSGTDVLRDFERPWIDHFRGWTGRELHPTMNLPDYGREIGTLVSRGAVYLMIDSPELEDLTVRYIQLGIDNFGIVKAGGAWGVDGGHLNGRKWPTVFAGILLDDAEMKSPGLYANEDGMTYYGKPTTEYPAGKPLWGTTCPTSLTDNYIYDSGTGCWDLSSGASGSKTCRDPNGVYEACGYRICCTSVTWVGEALAGRMLRAEPHWGNSAFFDYVDRWVKEEGAGTDFVGGMWTLYRNNLPPATTCSTTVRDGVWQPWLEKEGISISPNPMRNYTVIRVLGYQPTPEKVVIRIFNNTGSLIQVIDDNGYHIWDRTNQQGDRVVPGMYFITVKAKDLEITGKVIIAE